MPPLLEGWFLKRCAESLLLRLHLVRSKRSEVYEDHQDWLGLRRLSVAGFGAPRDIENDSTASVARGRARSGRRPSSRTSRSLARRSPDPPIRRTSQSIRKQRSSERGAIGPSRGSPDALSASACSSAGPSNPLHGEIDHVCVRSVDAPIVIW